jgi:hypothetical protein
MLTAQAIAVASVKVPAGLPEVNEYDEKDCAPHAAPSPGLDGCDSPMVKLRLNM